MYAYSLSHMLRRREGWQKQDRKETGRGGKEEGGKKESRYPTPTNTHEANELKEKSSVCIPLKYPHKTYMSLYT